LSAARKCIAAICCLCWIPPRNRPAPNQAQAQLAQARASLWQENATLAYAKVTLDRQNRLARDNAGTPTDRDQALSNYRQSEARIMN